MGMDVSPMSMQMMFPRAADAGQVQHNLNQHSALQNSYAQVQQEKETQQKQQSVISKDNADSAKIRDEGDRDGRGGYYQGQGRRQNDEEDNETLGNGRIAADPSRGHNIDISF